MISSDLIFPFVFFRKLKNRVAAQTARDRKKLLMTDLETRVAQLEAENKRLASENNALKVQTGTLTIENVALKDRLSAMGRTSSKTESVSGSAVSTDPLPQGQAQTLPNWTVQSLVTLGYVFTPFLMFVNVADCFFSSHLGVVVGDCFSLF